MLLAECNIQELVREQVLSFIENTDIAYEDLVRLVSAQKPIPQIITALIETLSSIKNANFLEIEKALNLQFYQNQINEDDQQRIQDREESSKDKEDTKDYNNELKVLEKEWDEYDKHYEYYKRKLSLFLEQAAQAEITSPPKSTDQFKVALKDNSKKINQLKNAMDNYSNKKKEVLKEQSKLQSKINKIQEQEDTRIEHERIRSKRANARIGYNQSKVGIEDTLDPKIYTLLTKTLKQQKLALENKYTQLLIEAEELITPYFLELVEKKYIESSPDKSSLKTQATESLLKKLKQEQLYQQQIDSLNTSIEIKKQAISQQIFDLQSFNLKVKKLQKNKTKHGKNNEDLIQNNKTLNEAIDTNQSMRTLFGIPSVISLILTALISIPFILGYFGVIPVFLTPLLFYTVLASPPAFLLITSFALIVTCLIYWYKAHQKSTALQDNLLQVQSNTKEIKQINTQLSKLNTQLIPDLNTAIKNQEQERDHLIKTMNELQDIVTEEKKFLEEQKNIHFDSPILKKKSQWVPLDDSTSSLEL